VQWHFLLGEGCDKGQGYLFARPVPLAQIPETITMATAMAQAGARNAADIEMRSIAAA
jgi:hypothetical protein